MAKLYFYYSAMNAGKTTTLLQSSYNYRERGMETLLFTPAIDDRSGTVGKIASRIGLEADAIPFAQDMDFFAYVHNAVQRPQHKIRCVLVDEAQFMTKKQVGECGKITTELEIPVLAYGLRSDFRGEPFEGSKYLLTWADELVEIKTICHCGRKATMNTRVDEHGRPVLDGDQVKIGGNTHYIATCRRHFQNL